MYRNVWSYVCTCPAVRGLKKRATQKEHFRNLKNAVLTSSLTFFGHVRRDEF